MAAGSLIADGAPLQNEDRRHLTWALGALWTNVARVREMVDAADKGPEIASVRIAQACGACGLQAA